MENQNFKIKVKSTGSLSIKDFEEKKKETLELVSANKAFIINNDSDKKLAVAKRRAFNKIVEELKGLKKDHLEEFAGQFQQEMKELISILENASKDFTKQIYAYEGKEEKTVFKATLTYEDETLTAKIEQFALENNCKLTKKEG